MKYYISFDNLHDGPLGHFERGTCIEEYRGWLEQVAGVEEDAWAWHRGDLMALGVYIRDKECATLFRLRFGQ